MKLSLPVFLLSLILSCGDDPPTGNDDTTPPHIIATIPGSNSLAVSVSDNIVITFSEKIAPATANSSNIVFTPATIGTFTLDDSILTIDPSSDLAYDTDYIVSFTNGITDLAGNKMSLIQTLDFKTEIDPANTPLEIVSSVPIDGAVNFPVGNSIQVTFNKYLDQTSVIDTSIYIDDVSSQYTLVQDSGAKRTTVVIFPDSDLEYDATYNLIITTVVKDTYGNSLAQNDTITFSTVSLIPELIVLSPADSSIATGMAELSFGATHPIGVVKYELYLDGALSQEIISSSALHTFNVDFSPLEIGTVHSFYCVAYDALDNAGYSDTLDLIAHWEIIAIDGNDGFNPLEVPNDLRRILARSSDSTLELRIEYAFDWEYAYPTIVPDGDSSLLYFDPAVDLALYFDTDQNQNTGRTATTALGALNDIGADKRIIVGLHGSDSTSFMEWNENTSLWDLLYDTTQFYTHNVPQNSNYMEIGVMWNDLGVAQAIDLLAINVYFPTPNDIGSAIPDFVPDRDNGHLTIQRNGRFLGAPAKTNHTGLSSSTIALPKIDYTNPFN